MQQLIRIWYFLPFHLRSSQCGNLVTARWAGDAHRLALAFKEFLLEETAAT